ncbi:MAG: S49 family peptidase [Bosea sp.]|uniref:S49 family peptidase n=1 Tax=Bosea sp. (in: a-proteobacteria) TaxID=1871050 RepID=UPI001ACE87D1|nr:S49 family peptidase [Bosea sp. (in: a-proteobacteria)]MBN9453248.1 S49 family peptidase [Bosea sp. (in: a-proteobacteria)]
MSNLIHIADRALNRPLLITPDKAAVIMSVIGGRIGIDASALTPDASRFVGESVERDGNGRAVSGLPYKRTQDGVGILTVTGSLVNRGAWIGASSGLTSYEGIKFQLQALAADPKVSSIILDMQSPGGEAVGAFETAEVVRQVAAQKPIIAVVNGMAASAGYAIVAGATEIVTTETGVSGSIGVVLLHADYSGQLAEEGIKPTLIFAGDHKVDANPFEPLPESVRADLQAEVNAFYEKFLTTVAAGRGSRMSRERARETQARTFIGEAAVAAGLADRVGSFESVLSELSTRARAGRSTSQKPGGIMSENNGAPAAETTGISQAQHDAALASARTASKADGVTEANARLAAIFATDGIKGSAARMQAAADLAVKAPGMSAEDVAAFVTGSVPASAASNSLSDREHPANALGGNPPSQSTDEERIARITGNYRGSSGASAPRNS